MSRATRIGVLVAAIASCLLAPTTASAVNYCVNDPACVAAGGTSMPTIEAAADTADNDITADRLFIGASATPYQLFSPITIPSGRTMDVYGASADATKLIAPAGQSAFIVNDADTQIGRIGISGTYNGGSIVVFSVGTTSFSNVTAANISNGGTTTGTTALTFSASGQVTSSTISAPMSLAGIRGISVFSTGAQNMVIRDTRITAATPMYLAASNNVTLLRNTLTYSSQGIRVYAREAPKTLNLLVASTLIKHDNSLGGITAAFGLETGSVDGSITNNVEVLNSTIAHPSPAVVGADHAFYTFANASVGATSTTTNIAVDGVVVHGPFTKTVDSFDSADAGGTNYTTGVTFARSNVDLAAGKLTLGGGATVTPGPGNTNVDPKFVDPIGGDYHLRYDSPLIDTGLTVLDGSEGMTDLDGRPRLANKDANPLVVATTDIGAYEYTRYAPVIASSTPSGAVTPGATLTYSVNASDKNAGEAAAFTYAWTLPGGVAATTPSVTFTAPSAPGTYLVAVTITDLSGAKASASAQLVVPAPGAAPVAPAPLLADLVAPKVKLAATTVKRAALLKRAPVSVKLTPNEATSAKLTLTAKVTTRVGGKPRLTAVVVGTATAPLAAGARTIKLTPSKAGAAKLAAALKSRGAKATYTITGTALDATGNSSSIITTLKVTA